MNSSLPFPLSFALKIQAFLRNITASKRALFSCIFLFLVFLGLLDFYLLARPTILKFHINNLLKQYFAVPVKYQGIHFSVLQGKLEIQGLQIQNPSLLGAQNLCKIKRITFFFDLLGLEIKQVILEGGRVNLIKKKKWNFEKILKRSPKEASSAKQKIKNLPQEIQIKDFYVSIQGWSKEPIQFKIGIANVEPPLLQKPLKGNCQIESLEGDFHSLTFQIQGEKKWDIHFLLEKMSLGSSFQKRLPKILQKMLNNFHSDGKVDIFASLRLDTRTWTIENIQGILRLYNLTFFWEKLYHPISYITGEVHFKDQDLVLKNIHCYFGPSPLRAEGKLFSFGKKGGEINVEVKDLAADLRLLNLIPDKEVQKIVRLFHPKGGGDFRIRILSDPPHDSGVHLVINVRNTEASFEDFPYRLKKLEGVLDINLLHILLKTSKRYHMEIPENGGLYGIPMLELLKKRFPLGVLVSFLFQGNRKQGALQISGNVFGPLKKKGAKKGPEPGVDLQFRARNFMVDEELYRAFKKVPAVLWAAETFAPKGRMDGFVRVRKPPVLKDLVFPEIRLFPKDMKARFKEIPLPLEKIRKGEIFITDKIVKIMGVEGYYKNARIQVDGSIEILFRGSIPLEKLQELDQGKIPSLLFHQLKIRGISLSKRAKLAAVRRGDLYKVWDHKNFFYIKRVKKVLDILEKPYQKSHISIQIENLEITPSLLQMLAKSRPKIVKTLEPYHLRGPVSMQIYLEPKDLFQKEVLKVQIQPLGVAGKWKNLEIKNITGSLHLENNHLQILALAGNFLSASFTIQGKVENLNQKRPKIKLEATCWEFPIDSWLLSYLPERGREWFQKLKIRGKIARLHLKLANRKLVGEEKEKLEILKVEGQIGRIRLDLSPLSPFIWRSGFFRYQKGILELTGWEGDWSQGKWHGNFKWSQNGFKGSLKGYQFQIGRQEWEGIPRLCHRFSYPFPPFLSKVAVQGALSLTVEFSKRGQKPIKWKVDGASKRLKILFSQYPLPIVLNQGKWEYDSLKGLFKLTNIVGTFQKSLLELKGRWYPKDGSYFLEAVLHKVKWNSNLVKPFEKEVMKTYKKLRPRGYFSLALALEGKKGKPIYFSSLAYLHESSFEIGLKAKKWTGRIQGLGRYDGNQLDMEGFLEIKKGTLGDQPFQNLTTSFKVHQNRLDFPNIHAKVYGGQLGGRFSIAFYHPLPYEGEFSIQKASLKELIESNFPKEKSPSRPIKGIFRGYCKIYGNAKFERSLKGRAWFLVEKAKILRFPSFLGVVLDTLSFKFLSMKKRPAFQRCWIQFHIDNGALHFEEKQLMIESNQLTIFGKGTITFKKRLNLQITWALGPRIQVLEPLFDIFKESIFFYIEVKGKTKKPVIRIRAFKAFQPPK